MTENTQNTNQEQAISMQINAQYVKDLSFEAPAMPHALLTLTEAPEININVDIGAHKADDKNHYTVDLKLKIQATNIKENKPLFLCELVYGGLLTIQAPETHIEPLLLVEGPRMLFPYARAIIGNIVRESGFPSLQINPIDFVGLYQARLKQKEAQTNQTNKDV